MSTPRTFQVETLEQFETIATYIVEVNEDDYAAAVELACEQVKAGNIAYTYHEHPGNDDHFGKVLSCVPVNEND